MKSHHILTIVSFVLYAIGVGILIHIDWRILAGIFFLKWGYNVSLEAQGRRKMAKILGGEK